MSPKTTGLYVHVPFCLKKCRYCDFFSLKRSNPVVKKYFSVLKKELDSLPAGFMPETIYFGGGTPSCLEKDELEVFLAFFDPFLGKKPTKECSFEVNPGTFSDEKAEILLEKGINRVSLGVQSMDDRVLRFLGRIHTENDAVSAVKMLKKAGIRNFSVDLMYGLPKEANQDLKMDLNRMLDLDPDHISTYCLSYEPGTPLDRLRSAKEIIPADDDQCADEYYMIREKLGQNGYVQYEISNFSRPARECRHNILYWSGEEYAGVGPAAHSFWQGVRYSNPGDLQLWQQMVEANGAFNQAEPVLSIEQQVRERIVFGLRMMRGVDLRGISEEFGVDTEKIVSEQLGSLQEDGLIEKNGDVVCLSEKALFVSNAVFAEII